MGAYPEQNVGEKSTKELVNSGIYVGGTKITDKPYAYCMILVFRTGPWIAQIAIAMSTSGIWYRQAPTINTIPDEWIKLH